MKLHSNNILCARAQIGCWWVFGWTLCAPPDNRLEGKAPNNWPAPFGPMNFGGPNAQAEKAIQSQRSVLGRKEAAGPTTQNPTNFVPSPASQNSQTIALSPNGCSSSSSMSAQKPQNGLLDAVWPPVYSTDFRGPINSHLDCVLPVVAANARWPWARPNHAETCPVQNVR